MFKIKTILISITVLTTLVVGFNYSFLTTPKSSSNKLFDKYSLDMQNNSVTLSVSATQDIYLNLKTYHNNTLSSFNSSTLSKSPSVTFSFPGQIITLTAFISKAGLASSPEYFLTNKTLYQPQPLLISSYTSLTNENTTNVSLKTNLALQEELSSVSLVNNTKDSYFYALDHTITTNTTIDIVDSYYRHFSLKISALQPRLNDSSPIKDPPVIIISNQSSSGHLIINSTVQNKSFVANWTTITHTSVTNISVNSNTTDIGNSNIYSSNLISNNSFIIDHASLEQSKISSPDLVITNSIITNSTILGHNLVIRNSIVNGSTIQADGANYHNVTFINEPTNYPPASIITDFNYTVSYEIVNDLSVLFNIWTNESANITLSLNSQGFNQSKSLTNKSGYFVVAYSNLSFGIYNVKIIFDTSLGLFNETMQFNLAHPVCNCMSSYVIINQTTIQLTISTNLTTNILIELSSNSYTTNKSLFNIIGNQLVNFSYLPLDIYSLRVKFETSFETYDNSFTIDLQDTYPPTLTNYILAKGYTNLSTTFSFSENVSGLITLYSNTSLFQSSFITNKSSVSLSYSQLEHWKEYYFVITVKDDNFNLLTEQLTNFYLKQYSTISFNFSTDKNFISNASSSLTIYPSLVIDGQTIIDSNYTLDIHFTFLNKTDFYSKVCSCSLKKITITFDQSFLDKLLNTTLDLTITLQSFNLSTTKLVFIYSKIKLQYNVDVIVEQINSTNSVSIFVKTNIYSTAKVYFGLMNQPTGVFSLSTMTPNHTIYFTDLFFAEYNLTLEITSWDNQTENYHYYLTINDTVAPRILSYKIKTNFTAFNCTIDFSELTSLSAIIYSENTGLKVDTFNNTNYLYSQFFSITKLDPYQSYKIQLLGVDPSGNQVSYSISNISLQKITSTFITTSIDSSVISFQNDTVLCNTTVLINNKTMNDSLVISTNATFSTYSMFADLYQLKFDSLFLNSLGQNSVINVTIIDSVFNISNSFLLVYVLPDSGTESPNISILSNNSFISSETTINLIIAGAFDSSKTFGSETVIEVKQQNTSTSLGFFILSTGGSYFNNTILLTPSFRALNGFLVLKIIIYGNNNFKTVIKTIPFQITSPSPNFPGLDSQTISFVSTSTMLALTFNEPVALQLFYGTTITSLTTYYYPIQYSTQVTLNLSNLMILNSYNYYALTLIDSLGNSKVYDNNSNYFQVFVQKLDIIAPYNTTSITVSADYHIQFTASEPVSVEVTCEDYFGTFTTCYSSTNPTTSIYGLLSLGVPGIYYTITKVVLTDQAQNSFIINPNIQFYYA